MFQGYYYNEYKISENEQEFNLCKEGQFLKQGGVAFCDKCNQNIECKGGYIPVYPKPGVNLLFSLLLLWLLLYYIIIKLVK